MTTSVLAAPPKGQRQGRGQGRGRTTLSDDEILRYSRHLILPEVGPQGQRRLKDARVVLIGAGGLGSPAALYLAAAGVGTIGLVDFDGVRSLKALEILKSAGVSNVRSLRGGIDAWSRAIDPSVPRY